MGTEREVYVISDLHVGGRYAAPGEPDQRGFRLCTRRGVDALTRFVGGLAERRRAGHDVELVINGDFVDFLAEESAGGERFVPFRASEMEAVAVLDRIVGRDRPFFDALAALAGAGGRLTLLLGNHDVELAFPAVRRRLQELLGAGAGARLAFFHDGEAYAVGDALIEHGNRYDGFNVVDHDTLRRMRSLLSRRLPIGPDHCFEPPPGSRLVASIMNPLKEQYPFVDLLKPETEAVVPILLALEPGLRSRALALLRLGREAARRAPVAPAQPARAGDIASAGAVTTYASDLRADAAPGSEIASALASVMPPEVASRFAASIEEPPSGDIASYGAGEAFGLLRLFTARASGALERRLPALLDALRVVQHDRSFDRSFEAVPAYLDAARALADGGFRFVVFGHTHLAKRVDLGGGNVYLNTGTWADLIRFPQAILDARNPGALDELRAFVADLAEGRLDPWIELQPTYVRLLLDGDRVVDATLSDFA